MKRWTREELDNHIRENLGEGDDYNYSAAVVVAMLYKRLYGEFPKIGMSGMQAEFADSVIPNLPLLQGEDNEKVR